MHTTLLKVAGLLALASSTSAYSAKKRSFAVNHFYGKGPLVEGRMDPIVNPGVASGHVHTVQGGNAFALTMSNDQALTKSTCTSSRVKNDLSNYWVPKLYFKAEDGTLKDVEMFYMNVYYFFEATTDKIEAFPPGLRMLVGDSALRTPPATGGRAILDLDDGIPQPVQWTCPRSNEGSPLYPADSDGLHGVGLQDPNNKGAGVGFPDKYCDGYASPLRADIHFPSCYDPSQGVEAYKTNMQFPTKGNCPKGWIHVPHLFYELYWNTPKFSDQWTQGQGKQPFILANGDPTGYSLHADFLNGWDAETLQQIIDNCDAGSSGMDKCPNLIGGLNDDSTSCNIESAIAETITGVMKALPGNNPIGQWGVNAPTSPAPVPGPVAPAPGPVVPAPGPVEPAPGPVQPAPAPLPSSPGSINVPLPNDPITSNVAAAPVPTAAPNTMATSYISSTTVIWTTVTESGSAATPTSPSSGTTDISGWSYHGCFADKKDNESNRVLSGIKFANIGIKQVTTTKCIAYCEAKGFSLAGTEYGGQCFCGNELVGSSAVDEATCSMACEGDAKETCGGSLALSVYSKTPKRLMGRHMHKHLHRVSR